MPRGDEYNPSSRDEHLRRLQQEAYYAPTGPEPAGTDPWRPLPQDIIRARLEENLYSYSVAKAQKLDIDRNDDQIEWYQIEIHDPINTVAGALLAKEDDSGDLYIPAGTCLYAGWMPDSKHWEPLEYGACQKYPTSQEASASGCQTHRVVLYTWCDDGELKSIYGTPVLNGTTICIIDISENPNL